LEIGRVLDYITNIHLVWDRVISIVGLASDLAIRGKKNLQCKMFFSSMMIHNLGSLFIGGERYSCYILLCIQCLSDFGHCMLFLARC
jgi:hypothetical protein